jgi:HK97 family phage prohead protease
MPEIKVPRIERRYSAPDIEFRDAVDGEQAMMIGHAAVFNQVVDLGYFKECIAPGAFASAIPRDDVRALWNHNPDYILGRNTAKTLVLGEDGKGLATRIYPPDTQFARDLMVSMKRGDVTQMSFAFSVLSQKIDRDADGNVTRTILDCQLYDVSPVTYPAYESTDISARSLQALLEEFRRGPEFLQPVDESWKRDLDYRTQELELARIF